MYIRGVHDTPARRPRPARARALANTSRGSPGVPVAARTIRCYKGACLDCCYLLPSIAAARRAYANTMGARRSLKISKISRRHVLMSALLS